MIRRFALLLVAALLTSCASLPPPATIAGRDRIRDFSFDGRFALRVTRPGQEAQSAAGRLSWHHQNQHDRVLLANPLGYGIAEIEISPEKSRLQTAAGKVRESNDPDSLIEDVTGERLPVKQIPAWLLGRADDTAMIARDPLGRPAQLNENGWQIDYRYDSNDPAALPGNVSLSRPGEIELRLRIETWKESP